MNPDVPLNVQNFYKVNDVDTFQLDRPFHRGDRDENNEFSSQRKDAIEEASKQGVKKVFGGGNKEIKEGSKRKGGRGDRDANAMGNGVGGRDGPSGGRQHTEQEQ